MNDRDIKPQNLRSPSTDPRIVYGACCAWWDAIANAGRSRSGLPGCPHCGGVLFEVESALVWWTNVDAHAERTGDTDYRAFIEWLRGKCFANAATARLEFKLDQMIRKFSEPRGSQ